jgi:hypothetical protein
MSDALDPRFSRQRRLVEVGEVGQARICAARAAVDRAELGADAAAICCEYLRRAGVSVVVEGDSAPGAIDENEQLPLVVPVRDDEGASQALAACLPIANDRARQVAEGSLAALVAIRCVLAMR